MTLYAEPVLIEKGRYYASMLWDFFLSFEHPANKRKYKHRQRKVSKSLTLQYEKKLYLLEDNRRFQGEYIDVWQYPDGTIELRANGTSLPFITYDRLGELDQGTFVDNKRLGRVLEMIKLVQDKRVYG